MTNAKSTMRPPPGRRHYDPGIDPKESTCKATRRVPVARLCAVLAFLMIALTIFIPTSSSSSAPSATPGKNKQAKFTALHHRRSPAKGLKRNELGLLEKITPVGLPANRFVNLFLPQGPPPAETLVTFDGDCTTPKTDFNFGDTICVVVTNAPSGGGNQRLFWGHTDGFLARETSVTSSSQSDSFVLTPTSIIAGLTLDNKGTWKIFSVDAEGAPVADTSFTIHDPATPTADLTVFKFPSAGTSLVNENTDVDFTIVVDNKGPDAAANVHLADAIPDVATFVSLTQNSGPAFTCGDPSDSDCTIASLARGAQATFTARYHTNGVLANTSSTYSATATSDTAELHPEDNTASGELTVAVTAVTTGCTLTCPDNITAVADTTEGGERGTHVTFAGAEPSGDCGAVTASPSSGSFFAVGNHTVTVESATGGGSCSFTITVLDTGTNPPTITCPASVVANASTSCEAVVTLGTPTTSGDNVTVTVSRSDGKPMFDCDVNGENCVRKTTDLPFSAGLTTVTWVATSHDTPGPYATVEDEEAHRTGSVSCTQTVTINDVTPPTIAQPPTTVSANASCQFTIPDYGSFVSDNCACTSSDTSESCDNTSLVVTQSPAVGTVVGPGTHAISITANDGSSNNGGAGNSTTLTFNLNVVDTTAPTISCPTNITTSADHDSCAAIVNPGTPTAADNCDSSLTINGTRSDGLSLTSPYPVGVTTITWTATDDANNSSSCSQTITVNDTQPPVISCPTNIVLEPTCPTGAIANWTPPVGTDNCAGTTTTRTAGPAPGSVFPIGTTTVTYTANDAHGNSTSCSFTVTVKTAQQTINDMMTYINGLSLSGTQKQGLLSKLTAALDAINTGKTNVACNKLSDFNSQVSAFINNGTLTSAQGQPLINSSNHVRNTIGCTNLGCS